MHLPAPPVPSEGQPTLNGLAGGSSSNRSAQHYKIVGGSRGSCLINVSARTKQHTQSILPLLPCQRHVPAVQNACWRCQGTSAWLCDTSSHCEGLHSREHYTCAGSLLARNCKRRAAVLPWCSLTTECRTAGPAPEWPPSSSHAGPPPAASRAQAHSCRAAEHRREGGGVGVSNAPGFRVFRHHPRLQPVHGHAG